MEYNYMLVSVVERVALVTVNRPASLNALNKETIAELSEAVSSLEADANVRAIVLTGSGEKAFVAGADIKEFADFDVTQGEILARHGQETLFNRIENCSKPIIAAINGFALGGGLELALACHFRIASTNARVGLPEVTLGLIPGYGGTQRLPQLIGKGAAAQMIFTGEMVGAERALELGIVNELVAPEELLDRAIKIASKIVSNSGTAIANAIAALNKSNVPEGFDMEIRAFGNLFDTDDFREGTSAFMEKRKPRFQ
ncbi:MAG: enoyl-CoA hydratase-related protein [Weeksellaceae bacterium]|nr:enoyl-CoA hydratase-related protein [Weeksellaceae bacterium]